MSEYVNWLEQKILDMSSPHDWGALNREMSAAKAAAPTPPAGACTCPSGDGSLRWPCPEHPPTHAASREPETQDGFGHAMAAELIRSGAPNFYGEVRESEKGDIEVIARYVREPAPVVKGWRPIEDAPKDNKRRLYIAQFSSDGELIELDWDASWQAESESWEIPQVYYIWMSARGRVEEPTHFCFMDEALPAAAAPCEPAPAVSGMPEFLADLERSRGKYPNNARMFDGLMGEVDELRRAYHGDGDMRAEAFDVAVCAFRIATEGDAGGNTLLAVSEPAPAVAEATDIIREFIQCAEAGRPHGKLIAQARDWLASTPPAPPVDAVILEALRCLDAFQPDFVPNAMASWLQWRMTALAAIRARR